MSLKHVLYVLNNERFRSLPSAARHLLTVLAACASDRGNCCWPGEDWLMRATGMSRATIYRVKQLLRDFIEIYPPGYKKTNSYYFPELDEKGKATSEVGKVLAARRSESEGQDLVDNDGRLFISSLKMRQASQIETAVGPSTRLTVRRDPSQNETRGGLTVRREVKGESIKKSSFPLPSQIETSQNETDVDKYDGSRPPTRKDHYDWIIRQCHAAGMDDEHTKLFFAHHRPYKWTAVTAGTNVCDLIADYVMTWKNKAPQEYAYVQEQIREEKRQADIRELERKIREEEGHA